MALAARSSCAAAVPPPAVEPTAAQALPDISSYNSPFTLEKREEPVPLPCTVNEDPKHPMPDYGSRSRKVGDGVGHLIPDPAIITRPIPVPPKTHPIPNPPIRTGKDVLHYPVPFPWTADKDSKHQTPDGGSYSSTPEPVPSPDKPGRENVKYSLPDPPRTPQQTSSRN
ncbi:unnamed protein product [Alopecurus aequalis]